jgi:hypothetical protein
MPTRHKSTFYTLHITYIPYVMYFHIFTGIGPPNAAHVTLSYRYICTDIHNVMPCVGDLLAVGFGFRVGSSLFGLSGFSLALAGTKR